MGDTELVLRAKEGDRMAFDALMAARLDRLYRVAYLVLRDEPSAQDAVQEALVRCWRGMPRLRETERFDAWLHRLLLNAVNDEAKRRRRVSMTLTDLTVEPTQPDRVQGLVDRDEIAQVFGKLSLDHRTIVVLHHYLGMTVAEAATVIGIPVGTAKSRLHYATGALRAALEADARIITAAEAMA